MKIGRILCVEDNMHLRGLIALVLENYYLAFAKDAEQARHRCRLQDFDLYLINSRLRDTDGSEIVPQIEKFTRGKPVLLLTYSKTDDRVGRSADASDAAVPDEIYVVDLPKKVDELLAG